MSLKLKRFGQIALFTILLGIASLSTTTLQAAIKVAQHDLKCNNAFPCPDELRPRTDFWIEVYSRWTTKQGVFHDSLHPERVYSAVNVQKGCSSKSSDVKAERARIKKQLDRIATLVGQGKPVTRKADKEVLALFDTKTSQNIRKAADRIRCQQGNRDRFMGALKRYGTYGGMVKQLVVKSGLHEDIHYLPFVESLYNPRAYSRVGAAGLWQIMPRTARSLGLELNATVDERLDLEAATLGAVRYLKDSRNRLTAVARQKKPSVSRGELTPFVITSYNYGVNGMRRALNQLGPDFIKVLNRYKSPSFQVAVKNFYTSFLAARHVAQNATNYFGDIKADSPLRYHTVVLEHPTSMERVEKVFGLGEDELKDLNRALTRFVWHGWRLMPKGYRLRLPAHQNAWKSEIARLKSLPPEDDSRRPVKYTVRKGDTACGIARAFAVKCKDLVDLNNLGRRAFIRINQVLVIPGKGSRTSSQAAVIAAADGTYKVKRGDSPCGIAIRIGVSCSALLKQNGLGKRAVIHPGQILKIPGAQKPAAPKASVTKVQPVSQQMSASYAVKPHDTACEIAERYAMKCDDFLAQNKLSKNSILRVGQLLKVPAAADSGAAETAASVTGVTGYTVRAGDTPCQIARRFGMECQVFQRLNNLKSHSVIYVGQSLKVHKAARIESAGGTSGEEGDVAGAASTTPLDLKIDFRIKSEGSGQSERHFIFVEAEETLGHYADWLGIGSSADLRKSNNIGLEQLLAIGQKLYLPVKTSGQLENFGRKREEYHRVLVEEFKENYRVINVEEYRVRKGDSPWRIADKFQLPMWVITRYNPELRRRDPKVGEILRVPQVKGRA